MGKADELKRFQTAIVVGASSGIGEAMARQLAAEGARVALVARRADELERVRGEIAGAGGDARVYAHDVRDFEATATLFDRIVADLGGLDLLIYAAGVMPGLEEHEYDFAKDRLMVEVNLLGAMAWMNPAAALMEARQAGTLVGVSSIAGERGRRGNPAYCTSKAALTAYLEGLRNRLGRYGVDVVTVKPGFVETRMTAGMGDLLWMIKPQEAASRSLAMARSGRPRSGFVPRRWGLVAFIIRNIPSFVFRKMNI